jgi:dipeptidyl aminopeptidase/acylaminoacyl peptidase
MNVSPWQNRDVWIGNSPVFEADKITTPLLILHNRKDVAVPFSQGMELYTALYQLGKPAWLLQYDDGLHGVSEKDMPDFTLRLSQFFDYYLMRQLPPKWMTTPNVSELEGIERGLEIDSSGRKP